MHTYTQKSTSLESYIVTKLCKRDSKKTDSMRYLLEELTEDQSTQGKALCFWIMKGMSKHE